MNIRLVVDDREFEALRSDPSYKKDTHQLVGILNRIKREKYEAYREREIARLRGKDVYFWGCGDLYAQNKHRFEECRPRGILVDLAGGETNAVDGLAVRHPDEVLPTEDILPIVLFSKKCQTIYCRIRQNYPEYEDVVICSRA